MRVGDLVKWSGRMKPDEASQSLFGVIVSVCAESVAPWYRVHWFEDNQEYNYRMDDTDILPVEKL